MGFVLDASTYRKHQIKDIICKRHRGVWDVEFKVKANWLLVAASRGLKAWNKNMEALLLYRNYGFSVVYAG